MRASFRDKRQNAVYLASLIMFTDWLKDAYRLLLGILYPSLQLMDSVDFYHYNRNSLASDQSCNPTSLTGK